MLYSTLATTELFLALQQPSNSMTKPPEAGSFWGGGHRMLGDQGRSRVLRIPISADESCFLAISFDRALADLSGAVADAVGSGRLIKRTDYTRETADWLKNVVEGIRKASIMVAATKNKDGHPCRVNPNVAYEIGIAHALDKQIVIIGNRKDMEEYFKDVSLRLDLRDESEFDRLAFVNELQLHLRDDYVLKPSHLLWTDVDWSSIRNIIDLLGLRSALTYGEQIHQQFARMTTVLNPLAEKVFNFTYDIPSKTEKDDFDDDYEKYKKYYYGKIDPLLNTSKQILEDAKNALQAFPNPKLHGHCDKVDYGMDGIGRANKKIEDWRDIAIVAKKYNDVRSNRELYGKIARLRYLCNQVILSAGVYMNSLADTLIQMKEQ